MLATTEVPAESNATPAPASEEVLIQAMDSFNSEDSRMLQRPVKANESESAATPTTPMTPTAPTALTTLTSPTTTTTTTTTPTEMEQEQSELSSSAEDKISIKLKFINDDLKLVTGSPKEMLGDFKRLLLYFSVESVRFSRIVSTYFLFQ